MKKQTERVRTTSVSAVQKPRQLTANEQKKILNMATAMIQRIAYASALGQSYGTDRDLYTALGYSKTPTFEDYYARYKRQDLARRIVHAYPKACWRKRPEIKSESDGFRKAWDVLVKEVQVFHYLSKIDRLSGIFQYGVLFLGFDDVERPEELREPVNAGSGRRLMYLRPYHQKNATITAWENDPSDSRYGLPVTYNLQYITDSNTASFQTSSLHVHHSRVLHVAEDTEEGEIYGSPRLQSVLNRLYDLEKVVGGSSEMFWRGAFPGYGFVADADADTGVQSTDDFKDQIEEYMHGLKRYFTLEGGSIENLSMQVADPRGHADVILGMIAAAKEIPKRILMGSERGELASSQDESQWDDNVDERRRNYCEPMLLRPFVDRMIDTGVLPKPEEEYSIDWPDIHIPSAKENAEVARTFAEALSKYVMSPGADMIIPSEVFLDKFMGFDSDEIENIMNHVNDEVEKEGGLTEDFVRSMIEDAVALKRENGRLMENIE